MARINSVLGPIDTENLGPTMMHEHILIANWLCARHSLTGSTGKNLWITP